MKSKKYLPTLLFCCGVLATGWGQTVQAAIKPADTGNLPTIMNTVLLTVLAAVVAVTLLVLIKANGLLTRQLLRLEAEKRGIILPVEAVVQEVPGEDFFSRLRKKYWEDPVPLAQEADITLHHDYDGIRELDNHLPPWWVNMFILTVIWAVGYMYFYHWGGNGPNQAEEYKREVETAQQEIAVALAGKAETVNESSVTVVTDAAALGEGELIFKNACAACHGQKGEGLVGPNFADEYWLHGGGIRNVFKTIKYGVPEKGMIAWSSQLQPTDMQKVASYILTLQGTNPPNQKAPQGDIWKDTVAVPDSSQTSKG